MHTVVAATLPRPAPHREENGRGVRTRWASCTAIARGTELGQPDSPRRRKRRESGSGGHQRGGPAGSWSSRARRSREGLGSILPRSPTGDEPSDRKATSSAARSGSVRRSLVERTLASRCCSTSPIWTLQTDSPRWSGAKPQVPSRPTAPSRSNRSVDRTIVPKILSDSPWSLTTGPARPTDA